MAVTALWAGPLGLAAYWLIGRGSGQEKPMWESVLVGDSHCGAGSTVGDFIGEWIVFLTGVTIAGSALWSDYVLDFLFANSIGIVFQYYPIAPMRGLSGFAGIKAALKADTISLLAFEAGMFVWMGITGRVLFHPRLEPNQATYCS